MRASVNGCEIHYEREGEGPALVLIHAGIADSRMWQPQVDAMADRFDIIRPDLRGFGKSSLPRAPFAFRHDIIGLLDHLEVDRFALVGCSMGGSTCLDLAIDNPGRVSHLVLVAAGISGANFGEADAHLFEPVEVAEREGDMEAVNEAEVRLWVDGPQRPAGYTRGPVRDLALDMNRVALASAWEGIVNQPLDPPAIGRLPEVGAPTLVVVGDEDLPHARVAADHLVAHIPGARLERIADAAHLPSLERPEIFNRLLLDFLTRS